MGFGSVRCAPRVPGDDVIRLANRGMVAFDLVLGAATIAAPDATLRVLGHESPSDDARELFRRCGPIWLTFAAAHAVAATRGTEPDWWALAWLRGTEIATDVVWAQSPGFKRPGARVGLWMAGVSNLAMTVGYGALAERPRSRKRKKRK
jgi:hypothetical protein